MDDLEFIYMLIEENYRTLGSISLDAVKKAYNNSRVFIHTVNGEKVGYLLLGPIKKGQDITIWQMCVDKNKHRMGYGTNLFKQLYDTALAAGASGIRLCCADSLQAKLFWESLGFKKTAITSRKRQDNTYFLPLK